jgi:hypothetical protein
LPSTERINGAGGANLGRSMNQKFLLRVFPQQVEIFRSLIAIITFRFGRYSLSPEPVPGNDRPARPLPFSIALLKK